MAVVTVEYKPNRPGIGRVAVGRELTKAIREILTKKAMPYAISISPHDTGEYADSFEVHMGYAVIGKRYPTNRVSGVLTNVSDHSTLVEWGRKGRNAHHVLRKTLEHLAVETPRDVL